MQKIDFPVEPIQWHEGMLLLPQHFQQADLRIDQLMTYHLSALSPFFWGVNRIQIDQSLLTSGTFRLLDLEAVMPDGLTISGIPVDAPPLQVNLKDQAKDMAKAPLTVYLAVPELHGDDADMIGALPRYSSFNSKGISDMNTGEEAVEVPRLRPNVQLIAAKEPPAKFTSMPIAKVIFDSKSFALSPYIPPTLISPLTGVIGRLCDAHAKKLRTKLGYLQQKVQGADSASGAGSIPQEIEAIRLKLIAGLLPFEAVYSSGRSHPYDLYKSLCGLAGQLSGVHFGELPPLFDPYDHNEIYASLQQVISYTDRIMSEIEESYSVVPFVLDDSLFKLMIKPEWLGKKIIISARLPTGISQDQMADWIRNCVIVSESHVTQARDNRVLGAARTMVDEVPEINLTPVRGTQLFIVENDPHYITPGENLCVFNDSDTPATRPEEILLYNPKSKS